jgi:hypothetical protein
VDNFYFVVLGIIAVWLAIGAAIYAVLFRWLGSKIEKSWKRRAVLIGWSGVLGPGAFLGHGIAPLPPVVVVLMTLPNPKHTDQIGA